MKLVRRNERTAARRCGAGWLALSYRTTLRLGGPANPTYATYATNPGNSP